MKKKYLLTLILVTALLCGCGKAEDTAELNIEVTSPEFKQAVTESTSAETSIAETSVLTETSAVTSGTTTTVETESSETSSETSETSALAEGNKEESTPPAAQTEAPVTEAPEETTTEAGATETFTGILIDEDCSDFEDPPSHDLPCMLMDECRASGYGIDILQDDGTWKFYMFDEKGQDLSWDYLIHTSRMDKLYVNVTGTLKDGKIYVDKLEEI